MQQEKREPDSIGPRSAEQNRLRASVQRVLAENQSRRERIPADFYSLLRPANLFMASQRERALLKLLRRENIVTFRGLKILDVGCGAGEGLLEFLTWGATPELLAGIDIDPDQVNEASRRLPSADLRVGNAACLPWPDKNYDVVSQSTAFMMMLDQRLRRRVAQEMIRVLSPEGVIIWYDARVDNPWNPGMRAISAAEITRLFPNSSFRMRSVTLVPALARAIVPVSWTAALLLEKIPILRTHILACIRPRKGADGSRPAAAPRQELRPTATP